MTTKQSSTAAGRDVTTTSRPGQPGMTRWERARHGYPAAYPIVQLPNPAILLAVAGLVIAHLSSGTDRAYALSGFFFALTVWAWRELVDGGNLPHRVLGGLTLAWIVVEVGHPLLA
ncbi:hypothetical protein [Rhodococcus opacus]|uniref:hypothetical protein n=1 Tax=Rhodococcus opacus TaxID=37919 RepID=UPI001C487339|nr:hypothetical protein [Rhodococcus opacus]MBV6755893.1 hypothetical protein [Rhodococcus opacus]